MRKARTKIRRVVFVLVACSLLFVKSLDPVWLIGGVVLILLGQGIQISSYSVLVRNRELTTGGPYRFVRNPFYVGTVIKDFGVCAISANWVVMAVYVVAFFPILYRQVLKEEKVLHENFGKEYEEYIRRVPRFLPRVSSWPKLFVEQNEKKPHLVVKNKIFPRILNLWVFIVVVVELSDIRWRGDSVWSVDHLVLFVVCVAILYVSFVLKRAGKLLTQIEKAQREASIPQTYYSAKV